jgi:hypothetical protein
MSYPFLEKQEEEFLNSYFESGRSFNEIKGVALELNERRQKDPKNFSEQDKENFIGATSALQALVGIVNKADIPFASDSKFGKLMDDVAASKQPETLVGEDASDKTITDYVVQNYKTYTQFLKNQLRAPAVALDVGLTVSSGVATIPVILEHILTSTAVRLNKGIDLTPEVRKDLERQLEGRIQNTVLPFTTDTGQKIGKLLEVTEPYMTALTPLLMTPSYLNRAALVGKYKNKKPSDMTPNAQRVRAEQDSIDPIDIVESALRGEQKGMEMFIDIMLRNQDEAAIAAARERGLLPYMQSFLSMDKSVNELIQAVKGRDSKLSQLEAENIEVINTNTKQLFDEIVASLDIEDLAGLDGRLVGQAKLALDTLDKKRQELYAPIDGNTQLQKFAFNPSGYVAWYESQVATAKPDAVARAQQGGKQFIGSSEDGMPKNARDLYNDVSGGDRVSYRYFDQAVKSLGDAAQGAKRLQGQDLLDAKRVAMQDQMAVLDQFGLRDVFVTANKQFEVQQSILDNIRALVGKEADKSMFGTLKEAGWKAKEGDMAGLQKLVSLAENTYKGLGKSADEVAAFKQELLMGSIFKVFDKGSKKSDLLHSSYTQWYKGLQKNKTVLDFLQKNLSPEARALLKDQFLISRAISRNTDEVIKNGYIMATESKLKAMELKQENVAAALLVAMGDQVATGGAGSVIFNMFRRGKNAVQKDGKEATRYNIMNNILSSDEFGQVIATQGTPDQSGAIRRLANSLGVKKFKAVVKKETGVNLDPISFFTPLLLSAERADSYPDETKIKAEEEEE